MRALEHNRIIDVAGSLNDAMVAEFGGQIVAPKIDASPNKLVEPFAGITTNELLDQAVLVPANLNLGVLAGQVGRGFGVMVKGKGISPGVISPRSTVDELHVLYLASDAIAPGRLGEADAVPTPLQRAVLMGSNVFQQPGVGGEHADAATGTATEAGHSALALRALTSPTTENAIRHGKHLVHDVADTSKGIIPAFGKNTTTEPGMLSFHDRPIEPDELVVTETTPAWLVDHAMYAVMALPIEGLETARPTDIIVGIGLAAAGSQLKAETSLVREKTLSIMEAL